MQAQIIAGLQRDQNLSLSTTTNDCEFDPTYLATLDAKLEMEMEKLDSFVGYEKREQNLCIEKESHDFLEAEVEVKALAIKPGNNIQPSSHLHSRE